MVDKLENAQRTTNEKGFNYTIPVIKWGQLIGDPKCPYMRRWLIQNRWGTIRLHHFLGDDPDYDGAYHDHPWWFITFVIKGSYVDVSPCTQCKGTTRGFNDLMGSCLTCMGTGQKRDRLGLFSIRFRPAEHKHRVESEGAWTFVITSGWKRHWGFWHNGVFQRWRVYLQGKTYACQD